MSEVYKTKRKAPMVVGEHNVTTGYGVKEGVFKVPDYVNNAQSIPLSADTIWMNTNAQPDYWGSPVTITQSINLGQLYGNGTLTPFSGALDASGTLTLTVDPNYVSTTTTAVSGFY